MSIQNPTAGYAACIRCGCLRPLAKLRDGICADDWKPCREKANGVGGHKPEPTP